MLFPLLGGNCLASSLIANSKLRDGIHPIRQNHNPCTFTIMRFQAILPFAILLSASPVTSSVSYQDRCNTGKPRLKYCLGDG